MSSAAPTTACGAQPRGHRALQQCISMLTNIRPCPRGDAVAACSSSHRAPDATPTADSRALLPFPLRLGSLLPAAAAAAPASPRQLARESPVTHVRPLKAETAVRIADADTDRDSPDTAPDPLLLAIWAWPPGPWPYAPPIGPLARSGCLDNEPLFAPHGGHAISIYINAHIIRIVCGPATVRHRHPSPHPYPHPRSPMYTKHPNTKTPKHGAFGHLLFSSAVCARHSGLPRNGNSTEANPPPLPPPRSASRAARCITRAGREGAALLIYPTAVLTHSHADPAGGRSAGGPPDAGSIPSHLIPSLPIPSRPIPSHPIGHRPPFGMCSELGDPATYALIAPGTAPPLLFRDAMHMHGL
ncbi:hypothetical protein DFH11DRAFT_1726166 [Phellopilus nigrolimitatus]|nr:hypothetical protein DFH11DRAFT_1726166 [Phellopilus nigrolimitatus]